MSVLPRVMFCETAEGACAPQEKTPVSTDSDARQYMSRRIATMNGTDEDPCHNEKHRYE
jgi:hypothetical protein